MRHIRDWNGYLRQLDKRMARFAGTSIAAISIIAAVLLVVRTRL